MHTRLLPVTIAIPTYRREQVLIDTIECLFRLDPGAAEILVLDQTTEHTPQTDAVAAGLDRRRQIRWLRLPEPSIPRAMNQGLLAGAPGCRAVPGRRHRAVP